MSDVTFPEVVDSTILSTAKSCWYKVEKEYIQHWKARDLSVHLHAGASFAAGMEAARQAFWNEGASREDAEAVGLQALLSHYGDFQCPPDSAKSAERTAGAFEFYMAHYPLGQDGAEPIKLPSGKFGIEFSLAEPLPILHPETGNPILYCGRIDQPSNFADGVFIQDEKTTSSLGATWSRQWDLRSQFRGYRWLLRKAYGVVARGTLVRGVSILKTKYDTQQAITYCADWQEEEWLATTIYTVEEMIRRWRAGYWPKALDHACTDYGGCAFRSVCLAQDPEPWLDQYFVRRQWNPVTREEKLL